ncbi:zinc finger protein 644 isoform X1 [Pseudochaenichthys georgianus]|uniref:zinc finger protein 644 isoform X1 n=1 Tax=Pseudochaenichthys georgianus TaxID=52239 RepID=UPI00146C0CC2|nr:zinc finger protein 644 isoform X1 [Pseudochaenichthys georgianus]XP_033936196.1 zinc finger protein 644 isoform X1 [Pseudochaenichthys georgianus]
MSDLKPHAQEDEDAEWVCDSPGRTLEPLQCHTLSLKNNAAGLSSDEHENPLNGTQPNPFVYSSVPAVPHAGNSLPSGALVNGPGSHPTSEVHCVLNKGTILSNNVLDAAWQAEKDTRPEVLPPPSELQSDAWKNTAGPVEKPPATQPGVNTPSSHSEEKESKLACSTPSAADGGEEMHISQPLTKQTMKTRSPRDAEWSESSLDDYDDAKVIRWDSERECFSHSDSRLQTNVMHQRDSEHNTHVKSMSGSLEKVNNSLNHTYRRCCFTSGNDLGNVDTANKDDSSCTQSDVRYSSVPLRGTSTSTASDSKRHIHSTAQGGCNEGNDPEDEDNSSSKVEQLKKEQVEQETLFFSCTLCNVNFKEKRHFHRHMMYHLGEHNQVKREGVSQPFLCRECGRLFCDSNSLMSHIIIHQERLETRMKEIKGLKNTESADRGTEVQCPRCVFGCNCPKMSVQHARMHDHLKHYYFCEECDYITLTKQALEAHIHVAHLDTHQPKCRRMTHDNDAQEVDRVQRRMSFFTSRNKVIIERCSELKHLRSNYGDYKKVANKPNIAMSKPNVLTLGETARSRTTEGIYIQRPSDRTVNPPQFQCCSKNMLLPSMWRVDRHGQLLLQQDVDVATALTYVEKDSENNDCEAFGSSKQANRPATADVLPSARNLKLDQTFCLDFETHPENVSLQPRANQNSLSIRTMSTPLHSTIDNMNGNISTTLCQRLRKRCAADEELEKGREGRENSSDDSSAATGSFLESQNVSNPYARRYFTKRQRCSAKDQSLHVYTNEEDGDEDCSDIEQLVIKEEHVESPVCGDSPESPCMSVSDSVDVLPSLGVEHKPCPYCPAMFESGVGLSNHVRGHLHRVGLSYNARHMVSPEQVALHDHQPRTRRRIPCTMRNIRKAVKPDTRGELTCPLCCGWFDTKTGLSNHVRGHLKRIGRSATSTSKSPLSILNELLQDKREHQNILQNQPPPPPFVSQKFISSNSLVLMHMGIPLKTQHDTRSPALMLDSFVPQQEAEAQRDTKASSSTLVGLLKMRRGRMQLTARHNQEASGTRELYALTKDYMEQTQITRMEPEWVHDECDSDDISIRVNNTLPRLSGHLRGYAHRKRFALFQDAGDDYKPKKPRPGLKKKILLSLNAEICTLTCRFCDLVFQGPLSIQEDWIRHLQRHLLHTRVPQSGTGMVEVLGLHKVQISHERQEPT